MRPTSTLSASLLTLLFLVPASPAFACVNGSGLVELGPGMGVAWTFGILLHLVTLPALSRRLVPRLASMGLCLTGATVFGLYHHLELHSAPMIATALAVAALAAIYAKKDRALVAEEELLRAETRPDVF